MPGPKYVTDFEFPASAGFTRSGRADVEVRSHVRQPPQRFAKGGMVKSAEKPSSGVPKSRIHAPAPMPKKSVVDAVRGTIRRTREQQLGLATGGTLGQRRYAKGGKVTDSATVGRAKPTTELDRVSGGKTPLRPGMKRGGKADLAQDRKMIKGAIAAHVRAPKPAGHGVKKASGGKMC